MSTYRIEKVSREVKHIISDLISHKLNDPRICPLTSITRVEMSPDLEWANVYISILGQQGQQDRTMDALQHARGFIQKKLSKQLRIRQCPHVKFHLDQSLKKANEVMELINESMAEIEEDHKARQRSTLDPHESNEEPPA